MKRFLLVALVASCSSISQAQIDWTPYEGNPVISADFDIESTAILRPMVVKWQGGAECTKGKRQYQYHMWYGKAWLSTKWMAYAVSDDGIEWTPADNAVLGPNSAEGWFDRIEATHGWVIADGDTLKMWYAGSSGDINGIGLAWSTDGCTWTKTPGPDNGNSVFGSATDNSGAQILTHPTVVKHDGVYHMWYVRVVFVSTLLRFEARIAYATSPDGIVWQVVPGSGSDGAVLDLGPADSFDELALQWPAALHNGENFELWYQGLGPSPAVAIVPRIGCAISSNGIDWTKVPGGNSSGGGCFNSFAQPSVILENDLYKMWYGLSAQGDNGDVVMYATSERVYTATEPGEIPRSSGALEAYPNPSTGRVNIEYAATKTGLYILEVRNLLGQLVRTIDMGYQADGLHQVVWDGTSSAGTHSPAGSYVMVVSNVSAGERIASGLVHLVGQ